MATIQSKTSRGHKYWYIVESRRVNGKPRPIVLAYLGKAEGLLKRLSGLTDGLKLKSYSHGAIAALLSVANKLDVPVEINKHVKASRSYFASKPLRNNLTVGITLLLGAIGRVCMQTSKRGWWNWAKTTSCQHLLRCSLSKIDSQHFWDLMDSLPVEAIETIEQNLILKTFKEYKIDSNTLFYDTTNFYTYIDTTNMKCRIAQRGKNKQKRFDLRQVGLAMVVTCEDFIPLFHVPYEGNMNDAKVFANVAEKIKKRMQGLGMDIEKHTLVFDRGNNSKKNMKMIKKLELHYVGALTPYHHKDLIFDAEDNYQEVIVDEETTLNVYRDTREIWDEKRTVLVFVSNNLQAGQIRGIFQALRKKEGKLLELKNALANPKAKKRERKTLEEKIRGLVKGQFMAGLISWDLLEKEKGRYQLDYSINHKRLEEIETSLGFRIIMTDRHDWSSKKIIKAYYGQSTIEHAFKNLKNPCHMALRPQYHWTDQKIIVHFFICVLGYLLATIIWKEAKEKTGFKGSLDTLLNMLGNIRLATILEDSKTRGKVKAIYKLEEMETDEKKLMEALNLMDFHNKRPKFKGVGVYN